MGEVSLYWSIGAFIMMVLTLIVALCYEESPKFRYKFKFCFYVFYVSSVALITVPFFIFRPKNVDNMK